MIKSFVKSCVKYFAIFAIVSLVLPIGYSLGMSDENKKIGEIVVYTIPLYIEDINIYEDAENINKDICLPIFKQDTSQDTSIVFMSVDLKPGESLDDWYSFCLSPDGDSFAGNPEIDNNVKHPNIIFRFDLPKKRDNRYEGIWTIQLYKETDKVYQGYFLLGDYPQSFSNAVKKQYELPGKIENHRNVKTGVFWYKYNLFTALPPLLDNGFVNPIKDLSDLELKGGKGDDKKIAILVYGAENYKPHYRQLNKKGLVFLRYPDKTNIPETYGYVYRYDPKNKKLELNQFKDAVPFRNYSNYTEERSPNFQGNKLFWRDISFMMSETIEKYYIGKGLNVLNLTPYRSFFEHKSPEEILKFLFDEHKITRLVIIPHRINTRTMERKDVYFKGNKNKQIILSDGYNIKTGLIANFSIFIFEKGGIKPVYNKELFLSAFDSDFFSYHGIRFQFHSIVKDVDGNLIFLRDGHIDDEWAVNNLLNRFEYILKKELS